MAHYDEIKFEMLKGKNLIACERAGEEIIFTVSETEKYRLHHEQDCCELVVIDDICGELADLVGEPILQAEENSSGDNPPGVPVPKYQDSFTWTFYRLATIKGSVVIRWYGESNGYYSESVNFTKLEY